MRKMYSICVLLAIILAGCSEKKQENKEVSMSLSPEKVEWFKDAKFGMFIHWGLYSILEGTYNGHTMPDTTFPQGNTWYAEWIKPRLEVPDDYYNGLIHEFNPVRYDPDSWVREAKNAGMK